MFDYIKGKISEIRNDQLVLECNNIGYLLTVSYNTINKIGQSGDDIKLHTYMNLREDGVTLYGFYDYEELDMFKLLQTVSKIGPKVAIGMLSTISPEGLKRSIALNDCDLLSKAPGIGKKTAQRIVLELKDKVSIENMPAITEEIEISAPSLGDKIEDEVVGALVSLGYTKPEVYCVLNKMDLNEKTSEQLIMAVLKDIGR
jgi:holliday junction DNA helicase RuvA